MADQSERNPFTRPGFIVSGLVVLGVLTLAAVLLIGRVLGGDEPEPTAEPSATADAGSTSPEPSDEASDESVCGLEGVVDESARLQSPPPVDGWEYQDTMAYPTSSEYGPGDTTDGIRTCFQHSPEGAVYAAANAAVSATLTSDEGYNEWLEYSVSQAAPNREQVVSQQSSGVPGDARANVAGFRLLNYDGSTARVDVALQTTQDGATTYTSGIYELVWERGDWRLTYSDAEDPLQVTEIPNLSGYLLWSQGQS